METRTFPVDVYQGDREMKAVLHGPGFTLEAVNSVGRVDITADEEDRLQIDMNETGVRMVPPWTVDSDGDPDQRGMIRVHTTGERGYLEGTYENLPIYTPFYAYHAEADAVYAIEQELHAETDDVFLGIDTAEGDDYYTVENVKTGWAVQLEKATVRDAFDAGDLSAVAPFNG